ncbi:MAG: cell division protein FtsL [Candidatus Competibacterales bacterium]
MVIPLLLVAALGLGLALVVGVHHNRQRFQALTELQNRAMELDAEWRLLLLERSTLATEAVVHRHARSKGMVAPTPDSIVYLTP